MSISMNKIEEIEDDLRMAKEAAVRVHHTLGLPLDELTLAIFSRISTEKADASALLRLSEMNRAAAKVGGVEGTSVA